MKKNIAVAMGGDSSEYEVSLKSANVVASNIDTDLYNVYKIMVRGKEWYCEKDDHQYPVNKDDFSIDINGNKINFDGVFIAIHGSPGENGLLQGYFDLLEIPYSSCLTFQSALTFNKAMCSSLLRHYGVVMAKAKYLKRSQQIDFSEIVDLVGLPCFVKPNEAGSSFGITKVKTADELLPAIEYAFEFDKTVIVEEFIEGREITCGVHNIEGQIKSLPLTEIISENEFFDYEAKYHGASNEITPAKVNDEIERKVSGISKLIFETLDLRGVCRVDFIVKDNQPYFIEVNTVPGLSEASLVPQQVTAAGYSLKSFFNSWVEFSLQQ
ncbi:D-alanine--D-alanine ligase [Salibacter sp.]|uniref:D-alanine--D-alanine ligase n=1 Tax=Salibacter sp. TaxID=2010995 RepID=UPI0028706658|nr:D-alanine--D-alanine ligase [Salibacter sp.]MDR9487677.1 D-alanine--D-alanine ligase [Salibacter sp.]